MKLVVGLGNPGSKYEDTKHNAGFKVVDLLAKKHGFKIKKIKFKSLYEKASIGSEQVIFLKPQTYMNNSGIAVREAADFFKIKPEDIIVIYDDVDIAFGTIRIKKFGSSGSHNGMKSIIYHLTNDRFPRVRVSIGKKPDYMDLANYVLSTFTDSESKIFEKEIEVAADAVEAMLEFGVDEAMNRYNGMELIE